MCYTRLIRRFALNTQIQLLSIVFVDLKQNLKKLSFCHKLQVSIHFIFATGCCKPFIFQSVRIISLKCPRSTRTGCRDTGIKKSEFVTKTQLLCQADFFNSNPSINLSWYHVKSHIKRWARWVQPFRKKPKQYIDRPKNDVLL